VDEDETNGTWTDTDQKSPCFLQRML